VRGRERKMPLALWNKSNPIKNSCDTALYNQLIEILISRVGKKSISHSMFVLINFFLCRCVLFTYILPKNKFFTEKLIISILKIIIDHNSHLDIRYTETGKRLRKFLVSKALGYEATRDQNIDLRHSFRSWVGRGYFFYRLLHSKSTLSFSQRQILIMVADLFLYIPSDITYDLEKSKSIVIHNTHDNNGMLNIAGDMFPQEVAFMATLLKSEDSKMITKLDGRVLTPLPHYSVGKSGVFCPSPVSFFVDHSALMRNPGVCKSLLNFLRDLDPHLDLLSYMRSSFSLTDSLRNLFNTHISELWLDPLSQISDTQGFKTKKTELSDLISPLSKGLKSLSTSVCLQSFGTSKDRFSMSNKDRGTVSFKNLPDSTLCRNYTGLERSWKFRNILIVNCWIQQAASYLHLLAFEALKGIHQDITYDQDAIYDFVSKYGTKNLVSLDLTDATTQQHSSLMEVILSEAFGTKVARNFIRIIKEDLEVYFSADLSLHYTSGTAQGTRAIWALFVMAHHIIVRKAYANINKNDDGLAVNQNRYPYILLGDNLTLLDVGFDQNKPIAQQAGNVTGEYMSISSVFNGTFDHSSSWYPNFNKNEDNIHGIEIAKRYFFRHANITPLPINFFMPFERNISSYQDFSMGVIDLLKAGLLPRLRFLSGAKEARKLILSTLRNLALLEVKLLGAKSKFVAFKTCMHIIEASKFKKGYKNCIQSLDFLHNSLNSILVNEFGQESYSRYQYSIAIVQCLSLLRTSALLVETSIPFKYKDLPEMFYLNWISEKMLNGDVTRGIGYFHDLPADIRKSIFSELLNSNHPLKDLALFREKELEKINRSLESSLIAVYCYLSTLDSSFLFIVKNYLREIRSPLIEVKSNFGLGKMLHKGYSSSSIYDISFLSSVLETTNKDYLSIDQQLSENKIMVYNRILGLQLPSLKNHDDILVMGNVLYQDFFSKNHETN